MHIFKGIPVRAFWSIGFGLAAGGTFSQGPVEDTWYEDKTRKGANFYDIVKAHQEKGLAKKSALQENLDALLRSDPALYELEKDHRFKRWMAYAEPRVAPSGDMSLLDQGQATIASLVPLDGRSQEAGAGAWEPAGPFSANTAGAGRLNWLEFHPKEDSTYMVGSPGGGLWFTKDAGRTWTTPTDRIAILGAAWGVWHPVNPDIIYLGTGDGYHSDTKSLGVLKSVDGGKTWNTTGLTYAITASTQVMKLLVDKTRPEKLLVATTSGVRISQDGGTTFTTAAGITGKVWDMALHPVNPNIVYASTTGFYRSTDGGATFTAVTGSAATSTHRLLIAVTPDEPSWVYLLRGSRSTTEGVSLSTDEGATFSSKGAATAVGCTQAWYDYAFAANPLNAQELAAGCLRIYRSTDGGATFAQHGSSYHVDIQGLFYRKDGTLFTTTDGGLWRNTPGTTTWTNLNNNLNIGQSYRMGVYKNDYDRVCTGRQDNGTDFADNGEFKRALGGDGFECFWNNAGTRFFAETQNGGFQRCNYANGAVSGCTGIAPTEAGTWSTPWGHDPVAANTIYGGRAANMWKSLEAGTGWTQMGTLGGSGSIRNFAVAPSNTQVLYVLKGSDVHKTTNGGTSWVNVRGTMTGTPVYVAVSSKDANDVWVTTSGYTATAKVWHSTDGGATWVNETRTGLPNLPCNAVVLDEVAGGIYVGMDVGVFHRKLGSGAATAWQPFNEGLPNASVRELEIAQKGSGTSDRRLLAATYGRGVWTTRLWDDSPLAAAPAGPTLRRFTAAVAGKVLRLRFQLGTDREVDAEARFQIASADGKILLAEKVPGFGLFERDIDLAGISKGMYYFTLETSAGKVSRRVAYF